jgi:hypothetical protein
MKTKKVITVTGIVGLALAGLIIVVHPGGCRPYRFGHWEPCSEFCDKRWPPGPSAKALADCILSRLDRHVDSLNLSEDQKKKYAEIKARLRANLKRGMEKRRQVIKELRSEMGKETPDIQKMTSLIKGGMRDFPAHMEENLDLFTAFYLILNQDQQANVMNKIRDKLNVH